LGYECKPQIPFASKNEGTVAQIILLEKKPTLAHLNFNFRTTQPRVISKAAWESEDPWNKIHYKTGQPRVSCQIMTVHWFLTMSLAYIRHRARITLSGHIKRSTREVWEHIFELVRRGKQIDMSNDIQHILSRLM
jgi:hypothetical protein